MGGLIHTKKYTFLFMLNLMSFTILILFLCSEKAHYLVIQAKNNKTETKTLYIVIS